MKNVFSKFVIVFIFCFSMIFFATGCNFFASSTNGIAGLDMSPELVEVSSSSSLPDMLKSVSPAIVGIYSKITGGSAIGSGVAIKNGGYILTNHHVVSGSRGLTLYLADGSTTSASVLWQDSSMDLAIVKSSKNLPYLKCSNETLLVGQEVIAVGTPLSLAFLHTVTKGIVSAQGRTLEVQNEDGTYSYMQDLIQHDASINPGNSGGPLLNGNGQVVGINTLKASGAEGIGFAIPISVGYAVAERLSADNSYSSAKLGVFGFNAKYASYNNFTTTSSGFYVYKTNNQTNVLPNDIILFADNTKINSMLDLRNFLSTKNIGDKITLNILRNSSPMQIECELK